MRSNLTFGLVAIALGCGLAGASAATLDLASQARSTAAAGSLMPAQGKYASGFAAIKSNKSSALKANPFIELPSTGYAFPEGLTRPDEGHAWRSGLTALAAAAPDARAVSTGDALQAPAGMKGAKGLSALKSGPRGSALMEAPRQASAGLVGSQRPAGKAWSDRGRESLRPDSVAPVPNGPSVK